MPTVTPYGRIWNKREPGIPDTAIYIGRPSVLGNPYQIGEMYHENSPHKATREEVIKLFETYARIRIRELDREFIRALEEVEGGDVICWCSPADCHGRIVLDLAASLVK
jgi:hypothetical protein